MVKRSGKSTWNSEKLSCGANLEVRTTMWLRKTAGSLESGLGHIPPFGVTWQPCRRVQSHPARATG